MIVYFHSTLTGRDRRSAIYKACPSGILIRFCEHDGEHDRGIEHAFFSARGDVGKGRPADATPFYVTTTDQGRL